MAEWVTGSISGMVRRLTPLFHTSTPPSSSSPSALSGVSADLGFLERTLPRIQAVLRDAEDREIRDYSVKQWLRDLKGVAHDSEDVLDKYEYEVHRSMVEGDGALEYEVEDDEVCISQTSLSSLDVSILVDIASKVREIRKRFDEIAKQKEELGLIPVLDEIAKQREELSSMEIDGTAQNDEAPPRPSTASVPSELRLFGRDREREELVKLLLPCEDDVSVVAIVGTPGIGKTAVSQYVYSDPRVCYHFELKGWLCVSEMFVAESLFRAVIEALTKKTCNLTQLDPLQNSLIEAVKEKRFLLVLDDVWSEKRPLWECLQTPLRYGAKGSKILITTRNEQVAVSMRAPKLYHLELLSDENCWLLFKQQASFGLDEPQNLVKIGREIVGKCKGLPLAAKVLGGILWNKIDVDSWTEVLESHIWEIEESKDGILAPLKLSYIHLPMNHKLCFAYSSVYPKDHHIDKDELVRMWMAQGLIADKRRKRVEDVGIEYFNDLCQRSLFQPVKTVMGDLRYAMHDLLHDLAQYILKGECSLFNDGDYPSIPHLRLLPRSHKKTRSLASYESRIGRTFLSVWYPGIQIKIKFLKFLECLRVLDLSDTEIEELPDSIGNLKHLRYLGLRDTYISSLPESVCRLYNLQTLDLYGCFLENLPEGIGNLTKLRHLLIDEYVLMPAGIGRLTNLQALSWFDVIREDEYCGATELECLLDIRGELRVSGLGNVIKAEEAKAAKLDNKCHLEKLILDWRSCGQGSVPEFAGQEKERVLANLKPHGKLADLRIESYNGITFPDWLGHPSFLKLTKVMLSFCSKCKVLPGLGRLPSLKQLVIEGLLSLELVGPEFYGVSQGRAFSVLEELVFRRMNKWEDWYGVEGCGFPRLRKLEICKCPMLFKSERPEVLPDGYYPSLLDQPPSSLQILYIQDCAPLRRWCRRYARSKLDSIQSIVLAPDSFR